MAGLDQDRSAPPKDALWRGAAGDFGPQATKWHETFRLLCDLKPHHHVLEIGCGAGRMAAPFVSFLTTGLYLGVDISEEAIAWAQTHVGSANISFTHLDFRNPHYRQDRGADATIARLPFEDRSFDFVFLASVFTHLTSSEVKNYVSETARLLRTGGYALSTYFLLNSFSRTNIARGLSKYSFQHATDDHTRDEVKTRPGKVTALDEEFVLRAHSDAGLLARTILGGWSFTTGVATGKTRHDEFPAARHNQDIVVAYQDHRAEMYRAAQRSL